MEATSTYLSNVICDTNEKEKGPLSLANYWVLINTFKNIPWL
jgi:hypothetical protein